MSVLRSWWYRPDGFTNFGDELGPTFLRLLGHTVVRVPFEDAEILSTGSILQHGPIRSGCVIWGTGWHGGKPVNVPVLDVRAVRGPLTAAALGVDALYGDPGLLASHFWPAATKTRDVGFVAHYVDDRDFGYRIDVTGDPETVSRQISSCRTVVSSSLHGCIVAASYGIPYMRVPHDKVLGGDTKWVDFQGSLTHPIGEIQAALLESIGGL